MQTSTFIAGDASTSPVRERIQALDVLRGVAVASILFANVLVFFGLFILPPDRAAALPTVGADGSGGGSPTPDRSETRPAA